MKESSSANLSRSKRTLVFVGVTKVHYDSEKRIRTYNPVMASEEWSAFLEVFDTITLLVRVDRLSHENEGYILDDPRLRIVPLPYYEGVLDFIRKRRQIVRFIDRHIIDPNAAYCVWAPNPLDRRIATKVKSIGAPLLVRVIGDAEAVARAIIPAPWNRIAALVVKQRSRSAVKQADGVVYVTLNTLQEKYPSHPTAVTLSRTNMKFPVELSAIRDKKLDEVQEKAVLSIIAVGSQQQNYKGHDLLIEAVSQLIQQGYAISLTLVGDGRLHTDLREQARISGLTNVHFIQHIGSSIEVAEYVSRFDLFVMPSRTEGMPKALLEAMTVGVLALGSSVGGIQEVLEDECRFPPDSVEGIVERVRAMINDPILARSQRELQAAQIEEIRKYYSGNAILTNFLKKFVQWKIIDKR